jgi:hypothetical protein
MPEPVVDSPTGNDRKLPDEPTQPKSEPAEPQKRKKSRLRKKQQ